MFVRFLFLLLFVLGTVFGEQYQCRNAYQPSKYIGKLRVPTNCTVKALNCPKANSWIYGIPEGGETAEPMIYKMFLTCHEGFTVCGYVPLNTIDGEVLGNSGVTIGAGVELGSKTRASFASLNSKLVDKLEPYFGLKRNLAACAVIERPLVLSLLEANQVTDVIRDKIINEVSTNYDADKDDKALAFASVPRGIRTAIVSVWYQFGSPPKTKFPIFWGKVTKNDWNGAVEELKNFYTHPEKQNTGDLRRRENEAYIIKATLLKCNRSVDVVFLLDESGSVSSANFQKSLDFVKNLTKAFPNDKLMGKNGSRFGLSTFSSDYQPVFYLSNYTNTSAYQAAIDRVRYKRGSRTLLGAALSSILTDQFTQEHGLRPEVDGLPRILIVLTDGLSHDSLVTPAQNIRGKNIVTYAMGIDDFDLEQLKQIAYSESHVYTLSNFFELEKFVTTITASTCNEPRPASLNKPIITNVVKDEYQYFSYKVNASSNLMLSVVDLVGNTFVYASRTNPHPYKYDYDWAFDVSQQKNKVIVISPNLQVKNVKVKRSTEDELTKEIYVSVTSNTDSAKFTIKGNECNPLNCTEGTNEIPVTQLPTTFTTSGKITSVTVSTAMSMTTKSLAHFVIATKVFVVSVAILIIIFA